MFRPIASLAVLVAIPLLSPAGYEQPAFIDGGQSMDGRFVVTAAQVVDPKAGTKGGPAKPIPAHGPFKWEFTWKDTKTGETKSFAAKGVQGGQVYAHLFVAPDGETFALWNHVTLWHPEKSHGHGADVLKGDKPGAVPAEKRTHEALSKRVIVYKKDGTILKELGVSDILMAEEWDSVLIVFNRAHWIADYSPLWFKSTPRPGYAFYRISPDYTVLEFRVVTKGGKPGRTVRVDLTTGAILPVDKKTEDTNKIAVRPFVGPDKLEAVTPAEREGYVPSLDPVRTEGKYVTGETPKHADTPKPTTPVKADAPTKATTAPVYGPLTLLKEGFKKLDTPTWLPAEKCLIVSDIETAKLFKVVGTTVSELREGRRGKAGPDGKFYGVLDGKLASWRPGEDLKVVLEPGAGKELSLNDLAVGANGFLYFTTLKDPDKGRVTAVDVAKKTATVVYDANDLGDLANPNGGALSADGKHLFIGVSNYKDKKKSGIYRFPVSDDGSVDVAAGKDKKWADVVGPDGIAVAPDGQVFATAGPVVVILSPEGTKVGEVKIPKGSGTNLCFGGPDGKTLYVTTNAALYVAEPR